MNFNLPKPVETAKPRIEVGDIFQMYRGFFMAVKGIKQIKGNTCEHDGYTYVNLSHHSCVIPVFDTLDELNESIHEKDPFLEVFDGNKIQVILEGAKK